MLLDMNRFHLTGDHTMSASGRSNPSRLRDQFRVWSSGLAAEAQFWTDWVQTRGSHWPEDFQARFNPETPIRGYIADIISKLHCEQINILDVGSGPITNIGYVAPN